MIDRLAKDKLRAEFAIWAATFGPHLDLTLWVDRGVSSWVSVTTHSMFEAYLIGRKHGGCAAACALAQVQIDAVIAGAGN